MPNGRVQVPGDRRESRKIHVNGKGTYSRKQPENEDEVKSFLCPEVHHVDAKLRQGMLDFRYKIRSFKYLRQFMNGDAVPVTGFSSHPVSRQKKECMLLQRNISF